MSHAPLSIAVASGLPPDAWLVQWPRGGEPGAVVGARVRVGNDGLQEGTWGLGDDWAAASQVFGSGVRVTDRGLQLVPPSHTLESLFVLRGLQGTAASNSLALLLAGSAAVLPFDRHYGARFATIVRGIDAYERVLARWPGGAELERLAYDNALWRGDGSLQRQRKPIDPSIADFAAYRDYAVATLRAAFGHAPWLVPTATCSSGYDSSALAVLAAEAGCRQAVALQESRQGQPDAGAQVAARLGLPLHTAPRLGQVTDFAQVADYLATGCSGQDACFHHLEAWLGDRLLITGFGRLYDLRFGADAVLTRSDLSGVSLQEVRLLRRFIHLPGLMIGARRHPELDAVARSAALAPWRIGGDYDRPVARRLLEEAGVPRGAFAVQKRAGSVLLFRDESLWSAAAREQCRAALPPGWAAAADGLGVRLGEHWDRLRWYLLRRLPNGRELVARWFRDDRVHQASGIDNVLRFGAGLHQLVQRYRAWLPVRSQPNESGT